MAKGSITIAGPYKWIDTESIVTGRGTISLAFRAKTIDGKVVASVNHNDHASVWSGTAESWVDLHALLPADFAYSYAMSISSDGVNYYVAGLGYNPTTGHFDALLWTHPVSTVIAPDSYTVTRGEYVSGGVAELDASDNIDLSLRRRSSDIRSRTEFEVKSVCPTASPARFDQYLHI